MARPHSQRTVLTGPPNAGILSLRFGVPSPTVSVQYLILAAGGAGGTDGNGGGNPGGGGGGGLLTSTISLLRGIQYTVAVGNGVNYLNGNNSTFSGLGGTSLTAIGGGRGASIGSSPYVPSDGVTGGSGGGNAAGGVKGLGTYGQGFDGGLGNQHSSGGGGGGAGAPATTVVGGDGVTSSITGTSVTYGGGGGGFPSGAGGAGGGGSAPNGMGTDGLGGGAAANRNGVPKGGRGVVIFRYLTSDSTITIGSGLTGSTVADGSFSVTTIESGSGGVSWS